MKPAGTPLPLPPSLEATHRETLKGAEGFSAELELWMRERGLGRVHLSLSDERDYVVAFALVEAK